MKLPEKFLERMKELLGEEYDAFVRSYEDTPLYTGLRVNPLKQTEKTRALIQNSEPIPWCKEGYYTDKALITGAHPYHIGGAFYFQEPSAMAAAAALPIEAGDYVLDLCAAPGGKSTQIGAALNQTGLLVANEIVRRRAEILTENIERFGLRNAVVMNEQPKNLAEKYPGFFDKIVVDAPCSGEGMFRKEPQAITEWSPEHVISCAVRQRNILDCAVKMLKPNGLLIYSTCTFSKEENEDNAQYLTEEKGLTLLPISLTGVSEGISMPEAVRIFPHKSRGEGHFVALFKKTDGDYNVVRQKPQRHTDAEAEKQYREFEKAVLNLRLKGTFCSFGGRLYLLPVDLDIDRMKVLRPGLYLGECKKNRFEPSHALALALKPEDFKNTLSLTCEDPRLDAYLRGEVIPCGTSGYTAVLADGLPVGWGKASGGMLKNHFPKYLRKK